MGRALGTEKENLAEGREFSSTMGEQVIEDAWGGSVKSIHCRKTPPKAQIKISRKAEWEAEKQSYVEGYLAEGGRREQREKKNLWRETPNYLQVCAVCLRHAGLDKISTEY